MAATVAPPETDTDTDVRTKRQPPYAVILHNDDVNTFEFVVGVVQKVFSYTLEKCVQLVLQAHETGRSVVWSGSLEVAELKADQIHSCGPDPDQKGKGAQPLRVSLEPLA
jgi:ATP-dependent Clp protease adaptor protein ClpS